MSAPLDVAAAWDLFSTPPRWPLTEATGRVLDGAEHSLLELPGDRMEPGATQLACYSWGAGPSVLLMHGWGGRAAQLAAFVEPLVDAGFRVLAFDAPSHGESSGTRTNIDEFVRTTTLALHHAGPVHGVVGHSLGAASAAIALHRQLGGQVQARTDVRGLVLMSPLTSLYDEVSRFAREVDLSAEVEANMRMHMEAFFHAGLWRETTLSELAPALGVPALIVHDEDDPKVPYADGAALAGAWPGADLFSTTGLGHRAPLRSSEVAERVATYLSATAVS